MAILSESNLERWEYQCREREELTSEFLCWFLGPACYKANFLLFCADKCFFPSPSNPEFSEVALGLLMSGIYPAHHLMFSWIKQWLKCKKKSRYDAFQIKGGRIHIKNISLIVSVGVSRSCLKLAAVDSMFTYHLMVTPQEGSVLCNKI